MHDVGDTVWQETRAGGNRLVSGQLEGARRDAVRHAEQRVQAQCLRRWVHPTRCQQRTSAMTSSRYGPVGSSCSLRSTAPCQPRQIRCMDTMRVLGHGHADVGNSFRHLHTSRMQQHLRHIRPVGNRLRQTPWMYNARSRGVSGAAGSNRPPSCPASTRRWAAQCARCGVVANQDVLRQLVAEAHVAGRDAFHGRDDVCACPVKHN